jgi:uncharacterized protein YegP (UPF0339 family)
MAKSDKIELILGGDGKYYFHKKAKNGKITEQSQGYKQKRYAMVAIRRDFPGLEIVDAWWL